MKADGSDVLRLTDTMGYDGGPFYSPDGSKIVYRAHRPTTPEEIEDYTSLLVDGLIRPSELEIYVMEADGSNQTEVTHNGTANFGPFWHPSGEKIIFASNMDDPTGAGLRSLHDQRGWVRAGTHHLHGRIRRLSSVQSGWPVSSLGVEPGAGSGGRDQHLHRGVGGVSGSDSADGAE